MPGGKSVSYWRLFPTRTQFGREPACPLRHRYRCSASFVPCLRTVTCSGRRINTASCPEGSGILTHSAGSACSSATSIFKPDAFVTNIWVFGPEPDAPVLAALLHPRAIANNHVHNAYRLRRFMIRLIQGNI